MASAEMQQTAQPSDRLQSKSLKSSDVFVLRILTNDLIFDLIFNVCSPATFLLFSRTCRIAYAAVHSYIKRAFNINRHLSQYFLDPLAFRSLQARTSTLVSGSSALQFFNRLTYDDSDLDIYVPLKSRQEVGRWILGQGYTFKPNSVQHKDLDVALEEVHNDLNVYYTLSGVSSVFTFKKRSEHDPGRELQVQVIVASQAPMEVILNFHSSVVLNLIAWDTAYSLYPHATFERRLSLFLLGRKRDESAIQKYENRGWKMLYDIPLRDPTHVSPDFTFAPRWIGDGHSWTIRLPTEGIVLPSGANEHSAALTRDPCIATDWQLTGSQTIPEIWCTVVKHPNFRYMYVTARRRLLHEIWDSQIRVGTAEDTEERKTYIDEELVQYYINLL
ncbi:hypothetical protein EW026_g8454 [Hermanssonia centrifuga]|uniref:Uncharacterized protein n=1 Tax=Hermanssonia centrifuga TaxID=98765 RepID=A0A4S4K5S2_9APHY|nr:hypothetical protein EW026_g8454 [Hermanssonia centrifuga]